MSLTSPPPTPGSTIPPPPPIPRPRPTDPLMGTTEETYAGSGSYYYAFGGAPKVDWSGVENYDTRLLTDLCYRSLDPVSGQKSAIYRTKGLIKKFEKGDKLSEFQKKVWEHLRMYGLDTITYLPGAKDSTKVQSSVMYHARFTGDMEKSIASCKIYSSKFDNWDKKNDFESKLFLLNSLSDAVKEGFETFNDEEDTFAATWLKLVHYLVTTTSKTFDKMKETIRTKRPQQYPNQDIEKMAKDFIQLAQEMDNAGYYTHGLTLNMVDGFLHASKDYKGTFHHELNNLRSQVSRKEQETIFLTTDEQTKSFAKDGLSYKDVCMLAVKLYNELVSNNMWEPSKLPKDRQAPPTAHLTKAQVLTLIENSKTTNSSSYRSNKKKHEFNSEGKPKGACFNCGDPNHMVKDCPKPKPTGEQARVARHKSMSKWKLVAPGNGESAVKTVNGKVFKWCAKCMNWTTTHNTSTHTGSSPKKKKEAETNLVAWEPSAWIAEAAPSTPTPLSLISIGIMIYCLLTFVYFIKLAYPSIAFSVTTYHSTFNNMLHVIHQQWYTWLKHGTAPLLWFILGYAACLLRHFKDPPFNPIIDAMPLTRVERRQQFKKPKWKPNKHQSARDKRLHPSYPLRLRKDNVFHHRSSTPTCKARRSLDFVHQHVQAAHGPHQHRKYHNTVLHQHQKCRHHIHNANKSRKGKTTSHHSFCQHHDSTPINVYKPQGVSTSRSKPNFNLTNRQLNHLQSSAKQVLVLGGKLTDETKRLARRVASLSPSAFKAESDNHLKCKSYPIIWDSGASICVTPDKEDFLSYKEATDISEVKGLGGKSSSIIGQGDVLWSMHDSNGTLRHLKLRAYHIPTSKTRLISTNSLLRSYAGEHITVDAHSMRLSGIEGNDTRNPIIAFNNPVTHLPTTLAYQHNTTDIPAQALCHTISTVNSNNINLSESQKELLRWHQRLGHLAFKKVQHLMRTGVLSHTEGTRRLHTAASKLTEVPKCAACLFGKQTIRSSPGSTSTIVRDRAGVLRAENLLPGAEVSVDHFVSSVKGRLFSGFDKGGDSTRYVGGCIFVDHASSYIHIEFQPSLSSHETLRGKLAFERQCRDIGVVVQRYMSDNGKAFTSKEFQDHLSHFEQVSKFAGVGAHHHNAQAERAIRTIMSISRTMMIHSGIHWPEMARPTLWPMAVAHACYVFNHVPDTSTGLSPSDLFTKMRWPHKRFHDFHVWGCPVYVLDKSLQDGKKIPKWRPRSNRSIYMGVSLNHASSVPLVLNVSTGAVTPQFHIVFDDWFATVPSYEGETPDFSDNDWNKLFGNSRFQYVLDEEEAHTNPSDGDDTDKHDSQADIIGLQQEQSLPSLPLPVPSPSSTIPPSSSTTTANDLTTSDRDKSLESSTTSINQRSVTPVPVSSTPNEASTIKPIPSSRPERKPEIIQHRRSSRTTSNVKRLTYSHDKKSLTHLAWAYTAAYDLDISADWVEVDISAESMLQEQATNAAIHLSSKSKSDPDLFTYEEAMAGEHRDEWIESAKKEISSLEKLDCWEEIPLEEASTKVLPGTWVFKVKRAPDGSFKKYKARYCIRGDLQEGDFNTYAPVVSFSSVRLFLAWSLMLSWYTCTIDFSNAFIQATLDSPTFIHLPRGFKSMLRESNTCLRLKKSIYGLSVAPRLWFLHLLKALKEEGLIQSKHDPCLMFRKDLIVIIYVDDLGLQAPSESIINTLIENLQKKGFELTREGSFSEYLGIQYEKLDDQSVHMIQPGLIQKILEATGMTECNSNKTPTTREALGSDADGVDMDDSWNYRSIVGMLLYLSTNTRPDIAYAVSQVARFSHHPKKSHATAIKTIVRYLSGTKEKGTLYRKPNKFTLDCFVDADFAGLYGREPSKDPISVKSRTGYIISVGGCYLLCKSQLQSTIALSTSESEYGALSQAMRTLIPIRETMLEIIETVNMQSSNGDNPFGTRLELSKFKTQIYEDNSSALSLAVNQKVTSRTKHWCVKFHFFWSIVNDKAKNMQFLKVDTKQQRADYLTKGLTKDLFQHCRELNQGW